MREAHLIIRQGVEAEDIKTIGVDRLSLLPPLLLYRTQIVLCVGIASSPASEDLLCKTASQEVVFHLLLGDCRGSGRGHLSLLRIADKPADSFGGSYCPIIARSCVGSVCVLEKRADRFARWVF